MANFAYAQFTKTNAAVQPAGGVTVTGKRVLKADGTVSDITPGAAVYLLRGVYSSTIPNYDPTLYDYIIVFHAVVAAEVDVVDVVWADKQWADNANVTQIDGKKTDGSIADANKPELHLKQITVRNPDDHAVVFYSSSAEGEYYGFVAASVSSFGFAMSDMNSPAYRAIPDADNNAAATVAKAEFTGLVSTVNAMSGTLSTMSGTLTGVKAKTDTITAGSVSVVSPVSEDGETIRLVRGDAYLSTHNRAIVFTFPDASFVPSDITRFKAQAKVTDEIDINKTGVIAGQTVTFELTTTETEDLELGADAYAFDVEVTHTDGNAETLQQGIISVSKDVREVNAS